MSGRKVAQRLESDGLKLYHYQQLAGKTGTSRASTLFIEDTSLYSRIQGVYDRVLELNILTNPTPSTSPPPL